MTIAEAVKAYDKIAAEMARQKLTIDAVFVPWSKSRNKAEKHRTLNWSVTLKRDGRPILTTDYSAGIAHCPAYKTSRLNKNSLAFESLIVFETETGKPGIWSDFNGPWPLPGSTKKPILPDPVDVVWSLTRDADVIDAGGFENWAADLGYDTDSRKAEGIYQACLEIALKLRGAIGEDGLSALRTAGEDY